MQIDDKIGALQELRLNFTDFDLDEKTIETLVEPFKKVNEIHAPCLKSHFVSTNKDRCANYFIRDVVGALLYLRGNTWSVSKVDDAFVFTNDQQDTLSITLTKDQDMYENEYIVYDIKTDMYLSK